MNIFTETDTEQSNYVEVRIYAGYVQQNALRATRRFLKGDLAAKARFKGDFGAISEEDARLYNAAPHLLAGLKWLLKQIPTLQGDVSLLGMSLCSEAVELAEGTIQEEDTMNANLK
jgi:hypothetical protein